MLKAENNSEHVCSLLTPQLVVCFHSAAFQGLGCACPGLQQLTHSWPRLPGHGKIMTICQMRELFVAVREDYGSALLVL